METACRHTAGSTMDSASASGTAPVSAASRVGWMAGSQDPVALSGTATVESDLDTQPKLVAMTVAASPPTGCAATTTLIASVLFCCGCAESCAIRSLAG